MRNPRLAGMSTLFWLICFVVIFAQQQNAQSNSGNGNKTDQSASQGSGQEQAENQTAADDNVDMSQYVGADACGDCHEQIRDSFPKNPHSKTLENKRRDRQGCEACHGPGRSHADAGDPASILRFPALSRAESSKICQQCHQSIALPASNGKRDRTATLHFEHQQSEIGCLDCHNVHTPKIQKHLIKADQPKLCSTCHEARQY